MSELDAIGDQVIGGAQAAGNGENGAESIEEWPDCSPQSVLAELHKVGDLEKGKNGKRFWSSYSKDWTKLTSDQINKTRLYFQNLDAPMRVGILQKARAATIAAAAAKAQDANQANDAARKPNTTKNEVARLMHLVKDPRCAVHWGRIHNPMSRRDLDARKSTDAPAAGGMQSMADATNGWNGILEYFNDDDVRFENVTVQYNPNGTKKNPYRARSDAIQAIAAVCHDIDPNVFNQRDIVWLKETYSKIKGGLTKILAAYNLSGKQNAGDDAEVDFKSDVEAVLQGQCGKWASMSGNLTKGTWPDAMAYAFVLLEEDDFNHVVRLLGNVGRDGESKGDAEEERRKRRKLAKEEKERLAGSAGAGAGLGQVIAAEGAMENKRALLSMMMQFGTEADKQRAMAEIRKGLDEANKNISSSSSSATNSSSSSANGFNDDSFNSERGLRRNDEDDEDEDDM
jgi:hypothetical protein